MNYLEFRHEQSGWESGITFDNISTNERYLKFEIITKDLFKYDGWYNYTLYVDINKTSLLDYGKLLLKSDNNKIIYNNIDEEKTIYKG